MAGRDDALWGECKGSGQQPYRAQVDMSEPAFLNRERFNRLLMLMQLHLNGQANEGRYALRIRRVLEANGGHPATRRIITDPRGHHSL